MAADGESKLESVTSSSQHNHVESAIETVLGNTEQSYEEFMGCFIGLKKEDVVSFHTQRLQEVLRQQEGEGDQLQGQSSDADRSVVSTKPESPEEDIETEELDEGSYAPSRVAGDLSPGRKFVQMDNYVDDAELLDDEPHRDMNEEDFASSNYESSFGPERQTQSSLRLSKDSASSPIAETEDAEEAVLDGSQTMAHRRELKSSTGVIDSSAMSFGPDGQTQSPLRLSTDSASSGLDGREDGEEAAIDGSETKTHPRELMSSTGVIDSSAMSSLRLAEGLTESSRTVDDKVKEESEEPSEALLESGGGCEMEILPGEADDGGAQVGPPSLMIDSMVHRTELKMSSRGNNDHLKNDQETGPCPETSSDEVQPFSLETDFDYDNVTLTPKWDSKPGPTG